ncbi:Putative small multi-drug export protein [Musa troglodytarum]|uniref:Small multi-drug export protein n=1 Tax=Musa troglodytarum TaxID=320322 RepID=A0A9E7HFF3_9LILI|nr:Putative small multi-drug export protein [Musa troglodytarum]
MPSTVQRRCLAEAPEDALGLVLHVDQLHQETQCGQLALRPHQLLLKAEDRSLEELVPPLQMVSMAFGAGSAIARRAVDAVLGRPTVQHEKAASPASGAATDSATGPTSKGSDACTTHVKAFQDCINNYESDISKCQFYMDMLNECRQGSGAVSR